MAQINNVTIVDEKTLRLEEDAKKGDTINLLNLNQIDFSVLHKEIEEGKNKEFNNLLNNLRKQLDLEKRNELVKKELGLKEEYDEKIKKQEKIYAELNATYLALKNSNEDRIKAKVNEEIKKYTDLMHQKEMQVQKDNVEKMKELEDSYNKKISELEKQISNLNISYKDLESSIEEKVLIKSNEEIKKYQDKIYELQSSKQLMERQNEINLLKLEHELNQQKTKLESSEKEYESKMGIAVLQKEKEMQEIIVEKDNEILRLKNDRTSLNIKRIGEDLEKWCNNEYNSYAQSGFLNCTWIKDNDSIKEDDETKGTKADFIFRVYTDETHKEELTSVTCEMKSEDPNSVIHRTNESHYKKLDKDRTKKKCEYALLVSELEMENYDIPIKKVQEYDKMYVVRPQYFITFLSIVESLGRKYQKLLLETKKEALQFEETEKIIASFNKMKEDLITKSIDKITKQVTDINKKATEINKHAESIISLTNDIIETQLEKLKNKIEKFDIIKLTNLINKLDSE